VHKACLKQETQRFIQVVLLFAQSFDDHLQHVSYFGAFYYGANLLDGFDSRGMHLFVSIIHYVS